MKKIIVLGGGAAGMMAAAAASEYADVTLYEKNEKLGKKIYITGKGRCNLTNTADVESMIACVNGNPYFMYSAFYEFDSKRVMDFFEDLGIPLKVERGGRVFPVSEKSSDIINAFKKKLDKNKVKIKLDEAALEILISDGMAKGIRTNSGEFFADAVIVATGGLAYPATGATGDGYKFAKTAGHKVTALYPSLVPLKSAEGWVSELMGLSLKNVAISVLIDNRVIFEDFGEMMFTHYGVSGPVILSASRYITDKLDKKVELTIDLKPALNEEKLDNRLLRDFEKNKNKSLKNALSDLLPQSLIPVVVALAGIDGDKKINGITKDERRSLLKTIKKLTLTITGTAGYNEAVITMGGIDVNQINPGTMESKIIKNLFFAGEVLDVDGFTGGYNLQIAFSTGYMAGKNAGRMGEINKED